MTEQEVDIFEDMFEETPFGKVDKAEFANVGMQMKGLYLNAWMIY